ncbi:MAG: ATP-binding protein, partial [Solirubrobacterales bacterium]
PQFSCLTRPLRRSSPLIEACEAMKRWASSLSAVVPRRYRGASVERPPVTEMPDAQVQMVRRYVRKLDERLEAGRGLWFFGDVGTGKTTLAMIVSQAAIDAGHSVAIYSLPRLLAEIRGTFEEDNTASYVSLLDRLADVDLLQVDDLGAEKTSAWVLEQLYSIINARYEAEKAIVVTTNLERDELAAQIGERTVSRLEEMCEIVPLFGRTPPASSSSIQPDPSQSSQRLTRPPGGCCESAGTRAGR